MAKLLDDLRYAHRLLTKAPGVTAVAIATLALGIGANTAIFSFADVVLWKPLPLPESGRLMMVMDHLGQDSGWIPTSPGTFLDWGKQNHSFSHLAGWSYASVNLTSAGAHGDEPERLPAMRVSEDFFKVLGLQFTLGRPFSAAEHDPGQDRVAVLTRRLWARRFGSDPLVVGTTVQLDGRDVVVAGVAPDGFEGPAA